MDKLEYATHSFDMHMVGAVLQRYHASTHLSTFRPSALRDKEKVALQCTVQGYQGCFGCFSGKAFFFL